MKFLKRYSRIEVIVASLLGIILIVLITFALLPSQSSSNKKEEVATPNKETQQKQDDTQTGSPPKQSASSPSAPLPPACTLFTQAQADTALKAKTTFNKDSAVSSDTRDLQTSFCTYMAEERAITLVASIGKTDVGKSMNSVEFGSGRPAGVQNVTTIGQSAFWNNTTTTLDVLKNNNRYSITLTGGTLDETLDAAKIIIPNV